MDLSKLEKQTMVGKKRVGRGNGSGKGKTSARGQKGQKARGKIRVDFEGGQLRLIKRLPFKRGVGNNPAEKAQEIKISELNTFKPNTLINTEALIAAGLVKKPVSKIKIIGGGDITIPLTIEIPVTKSVKAQVEKAGGEVK